MHSGPRVCLFSVDRPQVDETLNHLMKVNATFGVFNRNMDFVPILEEGETLFKRGLQLFIEPSHKTASVHMQNLSCNPNKIRWINELYFTDSDHQTPTSVKAYIMYRHHVFWYS